MIPVRQRKKSFYVSIKTKALFLVGTVPVLFMGGLLYENHRIDAIEYKQMLFDRMQVQAELLANTIGQAMWDMNTNYIDEVIKRAIKTPDLEKIVIRDENGKIAKSIWTPEWTGTHSLIAYPVIYNFAGSERKLGQVELYVSHNSLEAKIMARTKYWAIFIAAALIVQMLLFYVVLNWLLHPIQSITSTMRRLSEGETGVPIPSQHRRDEIGQMAIAIQTFRSTAVRADELAHEIEARTRLQGELETARKVAEDANQAKSQFLATMSHEIRTPLNGVLATAELLSETETSPRQKKYIGIIRNSGELLLSLLNDILDFAKIEAGRIEIHPGISNLKQAFEDTCTLFAAQADSKALAFSFTLDARVPAYVIADIFRLRQVMANLISNAVKYTERGHVDVLLTARDSENGPLLCFSVTDTGRGIPKESLGLVFDKFTQIHRNAAIGGTGLGLPICQSLVELMGGKISVESQVGQGSTFSFWIPLVPVAESDARIVAQLEIRENSHSGCQVLLAEDVEINQFVITEMLEGLGCSVTVAENGQVALDKAVSGNFDVVFMDCNMPVMDGYTATRRLREAGLAALPIIAVTAHAMAEEKQKCLDAGMSDFVSKPVRKHDLARILDQWHVGSAVDRADQPAQAVVAPAEPDFDPVPLTDWLNGPSPEKARRMIELTLKDSARLYGEIETAVTSRDAALLADSAHALKSVSAQVGATALSALCRVLEKNGKSGELEDVIETFSSFKIAYEKAVEQISKIRNSRGQGAV